MRTSSHVARYSNLKVKYIDHHNPDLVLLDADDKELHRIDMTRLSSTASMHKLMTLLGLKEICRNENGSCDSWASSGECERNPSFMQSECRRSCKLCGEGAEMVDGVPCRDAAAAHECEYWSTMGECDTNPAFMKEQCARSCGHCIPEERRGGSDEEDDDDKDEL